MSDHFVRDRLPAPDQQPEFILLDYPQRLNAAAELLKGGKAGDLAVVNALGRWTYGDLDDFSGRIARLLVEEEGLVPGNRVLLRGPNGYTLFAAWLGVLKAGGVAVTTMPLLRPGELATVIDKAEVSHALCDSRFIGDLREGAEQTRFLKHIVRMTCYVTSIDAYTATLAEIGAAWKDIVGRHYPAMALVEVVRLVEPQALVEIEATAVVPE